MENRKDFYKDEFNSARAEEALQELCSKCTLSEVLWIIRNITYDQTAYYSEDEKGIIYNGSYDEGQIHDATNLQREISKFCDLFGQVVINHRNFGDDTYLENNMSLTLMSKVRAYESEIEKLKERISELEDVQYGSE